MPRLTLAVIHVEGDLHVQLGGYRDLRVPLGGDCAHPAHSEGGVLLALDNISQETGGRILRRYALENPVFDAYESRGQYQDEEEQAYESRGIYRDRVPYEHDLGERQEVVINH